MKVWAWQMSWIWHIIKRYSCQSSRSHREETLGISTPTSMFHHRCRPRISNISLKASWGLTVAIHFIASNKRPQSLRGSSENLWTILTTCHFQCQTSPSWRLEGSWLLVSNPSLCLDTLFSRKLRLRYTITIWDAINHTLLRLAVSKTRYLSAL